MNQQLLVIGAGFGGLWSALSAARLLDVATGKYVDNPLVIVTDGRITSIGKKGDAVPAGAKVVDLPGATLLPGLIDMHTHIDGLAEIGGYNSLQYGDRFWSVVQVANAKKTLEAGFTTIRNVGSADFDDVGLREAIDAGYVVGPRVVTATYAIGAEGTPTTVAALTAWLAERDLPLDDLRTGGPTLEEAFLELTGLDLTGETAPRVEEQA